MNHEAQRTLIREAREAADKGERETAVKLLGEIVAEEHSRIGIPMDVRMRYWETLGALERGGMTSREATRQIASIAGRSLEEE